MEKNNSRLIEVEVVFAWHKQVIRKLSIAEGATVADAISASNIQQHFPEIDLMKLKVGIYSRVCDVQSLVKQGDRIEIYRPLLIDPKEIRRLRARASLKK